MAFRTPGSIVMDTAKTLQPIIDKWSVNGSLDSTSQKFSRLMDHDTPDNGFAGNAVVDLYFATPPPHGVGTSVTFRVVLIPTGNAPITIYDVTTTTNTWTGTSVAGGFQYFHQGVLAIPVADYTVSVFQSSASASAAGDPVSVSLSLSGFKLQ